MLKTKSVKEPKLFLKSILFNPGCLGMLLPHAYRVSMKKLTLMTLTFFSLSLYGAPRPGLWEIKTDMKSQDKKADEAQAKMKEALKNLTPAQRKQMEKMMGKSGVSITEDGAMKMCFTEESVKTIENQTKNSVDTKCETNILEKSDKKMKTKFVCEDGTTGTATWNFISDSQYTTTIVAKNSQGDTSEIVHRAKFKGKDCGDVRPFGK